MFGGEHVRPFWRRSRPSRISVVKNARVGAESGDRRDLSRFPVYPDQMAFDPGRLNLGRSSPCMHRIRRISHVSDAPPSNRAIRRACVRESNPSIARIYEITRGRVGHERKSAGKRHTGFGGPRSQADRADGHSPMTCRGIERSMRSPDSATGRVRGARARLSGRASEIYGSRRKRGARAGRMPRNQADRIDGQSLTIYTEFREIPAIAGFCIGAHSRRRRD